VGEPSFVAFSEAFGTISDTKFSNIRLHRGDAVMLRSPSGGGYGPPWERSMDLVLDDVREGFVSVEAALTDYGVVLDPNGEVDVQATAEVRKEMAHHAVG
jgi:N-methylhydantoinase B